MALCAREVLEAVTKRCITLIGPKRKSKIWDESKDDPQSKLVVMVMSVSKGFVGNGFEST